MSGLHEDESKNTRINPIYINDVSQIYPEVFEKKFAFFTICRNERSYNRFLRSAFQAGFHELNSFFFAFDNRNRNNFDGYRAQHIISNFNRAKYKLLIHDDIEFLQDRYEDLIHILEDLDKLEPNWAVLGNAGFKIGETCESVRYIMDPIAESKDISEPTEVQSLDENFLIFRDKYKILSSIDLFGFHFYATSCCINANSIGAKCFVIPFFIKHHSRGSKDREYHILRQKFQETYSTFFSRRTIFSTAAKFKLKNRINFIEKIKSLIRNIK